MNDNQTKQEEWLVYQEVVIVNRIADDQQEIRVDTVIRRVKATSETEAFGKFAIDTKNVQGKAPNIKAFKLDQLKTIE